MPHAAPRHKNASLRIYLLGPLAIEVVWPNTTRRSFSRKLTRLPTRKAESLLAYLVMHPESHGREKLAALFWGDTSDSQARASLRNALGILRARLGDGILVATRDEAQLNPDYPLWADAREFRKAVKTAPQTAVELYRGPLLADFYDEWVGPERDNFIRLYVDALLKLCQQTRAQGEHQRTIDFSRLILKEDSTNEVAHQHLMFSLAALGNRSAALQQYHECKRLLESELGISPSPETTALYQWIQRTPSGPSSAMARPTNLPIPLTSFIGRQAEIQAIKEIISNSRLLTITGAGGSGKTRLAIQAAGDLANTFVDGVWWIDLAALSDPELVPSRVVRTLGVAEAAGVSPIEMVGSHLHTAKALLVLDNCEHLIRASAELITALLATCPDLKIMVTSRESLGVFGEHVWRAPTMVLPEAQVQVTPERLRQFDGIRLFLDRAAAVRPDFTLDQGNAAAVVEICQRLDGIPLAIEMAAARVASLPIREIAERLHERFSLLTTGDRVALPRQQTLRAMMDWSYNLLSPEEQGFLCQLSIFAGGFTLEAAENVCSGEGGQETQVVNLLSHLVSKSLVTIEAELGEPRFRMLETIREYGLQKLEKTGRKDVVQHRHLDYFLALAGRALPGVWGTAKQRWIKQLEAEQDNMRAALRYSAAHGLADENVRLAVSLTWFWYVRSDAMEGQQWLEQAVALSAGSLVSDGARANALQNAGVFALMHGAYGRAAELLEESKSLFEALQDLPQLAWTIHNLADLALSEGDLSLACERSVQSLNIFERINDRGGAANLKTYIGLIAYYEGDTSRARALLEESLPILQEIGDAVAEARALIGLALIELKQGNYEQAGMLFKKSLLTARQMGAQLEMIKALEGLGSVECALQRAVRSATLLGAAEALRAGIKSPPEPGLRGEHDRTLAALQMNLDKGAFAKAWEEGSNLTLDQAMELALHTEHA